MGGINSGPKKPPLTHQIALGTAPINASEMENLVMLERVPRPPEGLSPEAADAWLHFSNVLTTSRILAVIDVEQLSMLCEMWVEWNLLKADVRANGRTYEYVNKDDVMYKTRPEWTQYMEVTKIIMALLDKFGMSPASRARALQAMIPKTTKDKGKVYDIVPD